MAKLNPFTFQTEFYDWETSKYYVKNRYYDPSTGRWLGRDPEGEDGGENLYIFCGNDSIDNWDLLGETWKVDRTGGSKAHATPENGDTINSLAAMIGLDPAAYQQWLGLVGPTAMPGSASQPINGCSQFLIPNTVVAYWAGNLGWFGRAYVRWSSSVKYLQSLGFDVDERRHVKGDAWRLQYILEDDATAKSLQGVYFWGHGGRYIKHKGESPYPAEDLFSASGDPVLQFSSLGLSYKMGLGLVFACDSNSGKDSMVTSTAIWKGFTGTLYPWPFGAYQPNDYIQHGDQLTH